MRKKRVKVNEETKHERDARGRRSKYPRVTYHQCGKGGKDKEAGDWAWGNGFKCYLEYWGYFWEDAEGLFEGDDTGDCEGGYGWWLASKEKQETVWKGTERQSTTQRNNLGLLKANVLLWRRKPFRTVHGGNQ